MQVGGQPVADVAHRMKLNRGMEGECFGNARREVEMMAQNAAAQGAGDEDPVARLRPGAANRAATLLFAQDGDGNDQRTRPTVRIAADDRKPEGIGRIAQAQIKLLGELAPAWRS